MDNSFLRKPIYQKLSALYENYDNDVTVKEDRTTAEKKEEDAFLDEVMKSKVIIKTLQFLKDQKVYSKSANDFKKLLKELWFDVYSRGKRILGSSGFEHVFLGEKKNGAVQGFHNWVYFYNQEQKNKINYLGHWVEKQLGGKGRDAKGCSKRDFIDPLLIKTCGHDFQHFFLSDSSKSKQFLVIFL